MDKLGIIERLADPELMKQMSTSDKVMGALVVTIMGMLITFAVLLILWGLIAIMTKILHKPVQQKPAVAPATPQITPVEDSVVSETEEDEELVAVITAAIAASLQRPIQTIIVKNIKRSEHRVPAWANVAKHEQLDSRRF